MTTNFLFASTKEAQAQECTYEMLMEAINAPRTHEICEAIQESKGDEEKERILKGGLPFAMFQVSSFMGEKKAKEGATPSYLVSIDLDHLQVNPRDEFMRIKQILDDCEIPIIFAQISARGEGLHIILPVPEDIEIDVEGRGTEDAICYYEDLLNIRADHSCKNVNRGFFLTDREHTLAVNEPILSGEEEMVRPKADSAILEKLIAPTSAEPGPVLPSAETAALPTNYQGIPLSLIFDCLEELMGGKPAEGSRNSHIFGMVGQARHLLDGKEEWIMAYLAQRDYYGLSEQEVRRTVKSALSKAVVSAMPKTLQRAIEMARMRMADETEEEKPLLPEFAEEPPQMPEDLFPILKIICKNVPDVCKPATVRSAFPCFKTHMNNVSFEGYDGTMKEARIFHVIIGESGSGKSSINKPVEYLMADIKAKDAENWRILKEWSDSDKKRGANDKKELKPELSCQCPMPDFTGAALASQFYNNEQAGDFDMYFNLPEIQQLRQLDPKGSGSGAFLCLAYDTAEWGQQRLTSQGFTGQAHIRLNFNTSSTIQKAREFFLKGMSDGTFNRCNFSTIIQDNPYVDFVYGKYDEEYAYALKYPLLLLKQAKGEYVCEEAKAMARQLNQQAREFAELTGDKEYFDLTKRAIEIVQWEAYIMWILNGQEWSEEILHTAEWMFHYDMWCKIHYFGDQLHEAMKKEKIQKRRGPKYTLSILPDSFSFDDLLRARRQKGLDDEKGKSMQDIYNWRHQGYIEDDGDNRWVKTDKWFGKTA